MGKLGLCVRYDCNNYGSMLQILATEKVIAKFGWQYEIIRYDKKTPLFIIANITRVFNPYFMRGKKMEFSKKMAIWKHPDIYLKNKQRMEKIGEFRKKYIGPYSEIYRGYSALCKGSHKYNAVMVGSDQLWTPAGIKSKFYNLIFVPDEIKKISFATSFGVSEIPHNQRKLTKLYLDRIDFLSVREKSGQKIIAELSGKNATIVLDPTLLLTEEEWIKIFPIKKLMTEPYIFVYFLGNNSEHRNKVTNLSKKLGLKIVTCPHMDEYVKCDVNFGDAQFYDVSPIDFMNLIRGASYICTDSFHGTVFSIIYHKKFMTFNRFDDKEKQSRNTRIDNLFDLLNLQERRFKENSRLDADIIKDINYKEVDKKLDKQRKISFCFLQQALNNNYYTDITREEKSN